MNQYLLVDCCSYGGIELATFGDKDTWPALSIPYIPSPEMTLGDSFKLIDPSNAYTYYKKHDAGMVKDHDVLADGK